METAEKLMPTDDRWIREFLALAATDFVNRVLGGDRLHIPIEAWEAKTIEDAINNGVVKFEGGCLCLPDQRRWSVFTLNREYLTHVAAYLELVQKYGAQNVELEKSTMDIVVTSPTGPIAVEVKRSNQGGETLVQGLMKILPTPDLSLRDRGDDPLRKVKALLAIRAVEFWVIAPSKRWRFAVNYQEPASLSLSQLD